MISKRFLVLLSFLCLILNVFSATPSIRGVIKDETYNEPIIGAAVLVDGTTTGTTTDFDGNFELPHLAPGTYNLTVRYISYATLNIKGIVVKQGESTIVNALLKEENIALESVVIVGQMKKNTDVSMIKAQRTGLMVASGVSAQQIAKTQDRDASEVIRRVPGISIIDGKFVMVRGLAQRYNNVWINNGAVPSSEADSRAFSFDIIPSNQLDNMMIIKTPVPELPADFAGGFIKITTKDIPDENTADISVGGSWNDATHFQTFKSSASSSTDFLGFDNGLRQMPGDITSRLTNNDATAVTDATRNGFNNNWNISTYKPIGDLRLSGSISRKFRLQNGNQFGLLAAANYTNSYVTQRNLENNRFALYDVTADESTYSYKYTDNVYSHNVRLGGMFNLTYVISENDKIEFKNIVNQLGTQRYTERSGFQDISSLYIQSKTEYFYTSRTTYNGQFTGTHTRNEHKVDWNVGYAYTNKNQPDRIIINQQEDRENPTHYGEMAIDQNEIQREFSKLNEHIISASGNYNYDMTFNRFKPSLKVGIYGEYRTRSYKQRSFYYRFNSNNLPSDFIYEDVASEIMQPDNFDASKLYVYEETDNRNSYHADNINTAAYVGLNLPFGNFNAYAGVRTEYNLKRITSYTRKNEYTTQLTEYPDFDVFPSLNMTYKITAEHQLRAGYGASVNRPEFREVSSFTYYDFDLFSHVKGNPDLKTTYIQNADVRYEWYPSSSELFSLGVFYKHFTNPIEWSYLDAGGSYTYTFENAQAANSYGIELEIRKNLDFIGLKNFGVNFNGTFIKSLVQFEAGSLETDRPMQGQSPYLINAGLFYQSDKIGLSAAILYNRIGKRIVGVGRVSQTGGINNDLPDTYEMPRNTLDINLGQKFGKGWEVKLNIKDIIGEKVVFKQFLTLEDSDGNIIKREQIARQFTPGRSFFLSLSYKF